MSESADYLAEQCHKDKGTYSQVETRHVRAVLAENERLREALRSIAQEDDRPWTNQLGWGWYEASRVAKTALKENNDEG